MKKQLVLLFTMLAIFVGHVLSSVYEAASNSGKHYAASGKDCSSLAGNPFIASVMVSSVM